MDVFTVKDDDYDNNNHHHDYDGYLIDDNSSA
jgi:hypothetical protein